MPKSPRRSRKSPKRRQSRKVQFSTDIEKDTLKNKWWRKVISTTKHMQVVLMSVPPEEELGWEKHHDTDQFFRIEGGKGLLHTKTTMKSNDIVTTHLRDGISAVVPEGLYHNVVNTSKTKHLKLYSIYSPPHHPHLTIDRTHKDEIVREMHEH